MFYTVYDTVTTDMELLVRKKNVFYHQWILVLFIDTVLVKAKIIVDVFVSDRKGDLVQSDHLHT